MSAHDAVLVYHTNGFSCGVTKFSQQLATRLGVPCSPLHHAARYRWPLLSIKASEIGALWATAVPAHGDLLLHDRPAHVPNRRIFYADEIGCPSTLEGNATRGAFRVLCFGMAHKLALPHFQQLKRDLDRDHPDYTIEMSCGIHEGHPWMDGLEFSIASMRAIFGDKLRVLGFMGDDAIAKELQECDAVALYFNPALRRNNTTYWAAVKAGKPVFTNRDIDSPSDLEMPTWGTVIESLTSASSLDIPA